MFNLTKTIKTPSADISLTDNNMYYVKFTTDTALSLDVAKAVIDSINSLQNVKKLPVLIEVFSGNNLPTDEAREFLGNPNLQTMGQCDAFVLKSLAQKIAGNLFLRLHKPQRPTKMFTDINEAIQWLEENRK